MVHAGVTPARAGLFRRFSTNCETKTISRRSLTFGSTLRGRCSIFRCQPLARRCGLQQHGGLFTTLCGIGLSMDAQDDFGDGSALHAGEDNEGFAGADSARCIQFCRSTRFMLLEARCRHDESLRRNMPPKCLLWNFSLVWEPSDEEGRRPGEFLQFLGTDIMDFELLSFC